MTLVEKIKLLFGRKSLDGLNLFNGAGTFGSSQYNAPFHYNQVMNALQGYAFTCIHKRAKYVAGLGIYIARKDAEGNLEPVENHWLNELLEDPYKPAALTMSQVLYYIQMSKDITGNAYVWTPTNNTSKPQQIYVLPPSQVTIGLNNEMFGSEVLAYEWRRGADIILSLIHI